MILVGGAKSRSRVAPNHHDWVAHILLLEVNVKGRVPRYSENFQIFGFHETVKRLEISSGPQESSYKPAQTLSTDFLEPKNGAVDLTTPSELGDIGIVFFES